MTALTLRGGLIRAAVIVVALLALLATGRYVAVSPQLAMLIAGLVLFVGVVAVDLAAVPVLVAPLLLVTARVGGENLNLSLSDALLAFAFLPALLVAIGGVSRAMRQALWLAAGYQAATLFTVLANPYRANIVEWFHAGMLVLGAIVIGWAIGRSGRARLAVSLLLAAGIVLALSNIAQGVQQVLGGDFGPVYMRWPYHAHKNAIGTVLALLAVIAYARPVWLGWSRRASLLAFWIMVAGLAATQSRQAILALAIAIVVLVMRRTKTHRRSKGILLAVIPAMALVSALIQDQIQSGNEFNSYFQRLAWFQDAIALWQTDPWVGVGLRWWYTDRFPNRFQPPNAEMDTLTSGGVIALVAFLALLIGTWLIARRIDPVYGVVAELVLLVRFIQSQFDLFWVSVQASLPFLVLGICLGALAHRDGLVAAQSTTRVQVERARHPSGSAA